MQTITDNTQKGCILFFLCLISFFTFIYFSFTSFVFCGLSPKDNPTTKGIIVKSSIEKSKIERRGYSINVTYEYYVEGKKYLSSRICCDTSANEFSKDIIEKYPFHSEVTVYYRENKPSFSVIEPRLGRSGFVLAFGFGIIFIGTLFLLIFEARNQ